MTLSTAMQIADEPQNDVPQSTEPIVIDLSEVSVQYRLPVEPIHSLKEQAIRRLTGQRIEFHEFWALQSVDLQVRRGEFIGLIGRNGAGKSTLLRVIARVLRPTAGKVWVKGTVAPLIELGAGFHPELTGRENVFLNGAMLGYSHNQIKSKFDRIVEFAELADFIDSPLRTYSSGMVARLGFSVAVDVEPDILIVDEVLSVGDEMFQKKCMDKMREFRDKGTTILFVTHGVDILRGLCDRAVLLDKGQVVTVGAVDETIDAYRSVQTA